MLLSDRLAKLVAGGLPERSPDPSDRRKVIYSLSKKGEALLPVVLAMRQWGEDWGYGEMEIVLADTKSRRPVRRIKVLAEDGRELSLGDMTWISRSELAAKADQAA